MFKKNNINPFKAVFLTLTFPLWVLILLFNLENVFEYAIIGDSIWKDLYEYFRKK